MVRPVSEDRVHLSIEFNEFLRMMSRNEQQEVNKDYLVQAFRLRDIK